MKYLVYLPALMLLFVYSGTGFSAAAPERAGELKTWREQCNDPDYDLRLAYIEQAIETGDVNIQRICIRAALESDNTDIRNLGLRAAIASTEKVFFDIEMPKEYNEALKMAGNNEQARREVESMPIYRAYGYLKQGISFIIQGASVKKGNSQWYSIASNIKQEESSSGPADVVGSTVRWTGKILSDRHYYDCDLNVQLMPGAMLDGSLQCDNWLPYHLSSKLLD